MSYWFYPPRLGLISPLPSHPVHTPPPKENISVHTLRQCFVYAFLQHPHRASMHSSHLILPVPCCNICLHLSTHCVTENQDHVSLIFADPMCDRSFWHILNPGTELNWQDDIYHNSAQGTARYTRTNVSSNRW